MGDNIYSVDMQGVTHIVKSDSVYNLVSESILGEPSFCTPAFVGDKIFMRGEKYLYCIGE